MTSVLDSVSESPPEVVVDTSQTQRSRSWTALAIVVVIAPLVVAAVVLIVRGWNNLVPTDDIALTEVQVREIGRHAVFTVRVLPLPLASPGPGALLFACAGVLAVAKSIGRTRCGRVADQRCVDRRHHPARRPARWAGAGGIHVGAARLVLLRGRPGDALPAVDAARHVAAVCPGHRVAVEHDVRRSMGAAGRVRRRVVRGAITRRLRRSGRHRVRRHRRVAHGADGATGMASFLRAAARRRARDLRRRRRRAVGPAGMAAAHRATGKSRRPLAVRARPAAVPLVRVRAWCHRSPVGCGPAPGRDRTHGRCEPQPRGRSRHARRVGRRCPARVEMPARRVTAPPRDRRRVDTGERARRSRASATM